MALPGLVCAVGEQLDSPWPRPTHGVPSSAQVEAAGSLRLSRITNNIWNRNQPARSNRFAVFVDGEITGLRAAGLRLGVAASGPSEGDHDLLLALLDSGVALDELVRRCEGGFFIAVHDRIRDVVSFASDRFGLRPHYYSTHPKGFILAPTLRDCLDAPWVSRVLNQASLAEYFCLQCVLEERTLVRDVMLFPAGAIAELDLRSRVFVARPYAGWDEFQSDGSVRSVDAAIEEVANLFGAACAAAGRLDERCGVYLSGGLDSRLILAALKNPGAMHTFCFGPPDSPDIVYARRVARAARTQHHEFLMRDGEWLRKIADRHARLTEGGHGLSHAHNLWRVEEAARHIDVNFSGHFGDLLLGGSYVYDGDPADVTESLFQLFHGKWGGGFRDPAHFATSTLLAADDLHERMRDALERSFAPFAGLPAPTAHDLFALQFHGRKQIQYYLVHNRPWIESRVPFLDLALLRHVYGLPPVLRADRRLQCAVLERFSPALAAIPWTATRQPAANRGFAKLRARVESHLASLGPAFAGIGGGAPRGTLFNHAYAEWLGRDVADWAAERVLRREGTARKLFREAFLRQLIGSTAGAGEVARSSATTLGLVLTLDLVAEHLRLEL